MFCTIITGLSGIMPLQVFRGVGTWKVYNDKCKTFGATLSSVTSADEQAFVQGIVPVHFVSFHYRTSHDVFVRRSNSKTCVLVDRAQQTGFYLLYGLCKA